jgi:amyloid beta precursor protein binding protein 1
MLLDILFPLIFSFCFYLFIYLFIFIISFTEGKSFFSQFQLVIASNQPESLLLPLSSILTVPLIVIQSYGLLGSIRLQYKDHEIIESKPENGKMDLRIADAFPELVEYCDSFDLEGDTLNDREHGHVPYIVILYKALQQYKLSSSSSSSSSSNGGTCFPSDDASKAAFKESIAKMARSSAEDNFQEALKEAYRAYVPLEIPYEVQNILDEDRNNASVLTESSSHFRYLST